jgi:hypothetical protein
VEDADEPVREGAQGLVVGPATVPLSPRQERRWNQVDPITPAPHLRLVWPQWQGPGTESVRSLASEFSLRYRSARLLGWHEGAPSGSA